MTDNTPITAKKWNNYFPVNRDATSSRRGFLKTAGVIGSTVASGGIVTARDTQDDVQVFEFAGYIPGWYATHPGTWKGEAFAGTVNPTLQLDAGKRYELQWTNGDGVGHDFIIRNTTGEWVAGTEMGFGSGTTKSVQFTATGEMTAYFCTVHPVQMQGRVTVSGRTTKGPNTELPDDISPVTETSTITFPDQPIENGEVTAESTTVPTGGFITIHTPRIMKRPRTIKDIKKSIVGWSAYLDPGIHENVSISVEDVATTYPKLIAMNHRDSNDNQLYDFIGNGTKFASADWPYFTPKGRPVIDSATLTS